MPLLCQGAASYSKPPRLSFSISPISSRTIANVRLVAIPSPAHLKENEYVGRSSLRKGALYVAAGVIASMTRPRKALAEEQQRVIENKLETMAADPEVEEIRKIQRGVRLYDVKKKCFTALPDLLKHGELLNDADVVCIGEYHDSPADHTMQRLILDAITYALVQELRQAPSGKEPALPSRRLVVGLEYFNRTQQEILDKFVFGDGSMTGTEFREAVNWDKEWVYDWSSYAPLFDFCQLNQTRVLGLNIPASVTRAVGRNGVKNTPQWLQDVLPTLDLSNLPHRRRFEDIMQSFDTQDAISRQGLPIEDFKPNADMNNYYESQVLWDESMADNACTYLSTNKGRMVLMVGVNHAWRDAIPDRIEKRSKEMGKRNLRVASVVPWRGSMDPEKLPPYADYIWSVDDKDGGLDVGEAMKTQRERLQAKEKIFPAGYI